MEFKSKNITARIRDNLIGGGQDFEQLLEKTSSQTEHIVSKHTQSLHGSSNDIDSSTSSYSSDDLSSSSLGSVVSKKESQDNIEFVSGGFTDELLWTAGNFKTELIDLVPDPIKSEDSETESKFIELSSLCKDKVDDREFEFANDIKEEENVHIEFVQEKLVNGKVVKLWSCTECGREFQHHYTYLRHLPTHTNIRDFVCKLCGKAFRQLSTLSQHRVIHSKDRPFNCEVCHKDFNRISTLISHRKTHSKVKNFQCHICLKGFHQKGNLRNHIYIHSNERPYRCNLCSKGFNQMSNLVCHKQKAHCSIVAATWQCSRCEESFSKRNLLRSHELAKHQIKDSKEDVPENSQPIETQSVTICEKPAINGIETNRYYFLPIPLSPSVVVYVIHGTLVHIP